MNIIEWLIHTIFLVIFSGGSIARVVRGIIWTWQGKNREGKSPMDIDILKGSDSNTPSSPGSSRKDTGSNNSNNNNKSSKNGNNENNNPNSSSAAIDFSKEGVSGTFSDLSVSVSSSQGTSLLFFSSFSPCLHFFPSRIPSY